VLYAGDAGETAPDPVGALVDTISAVVNDTTHNCATLGVSWAQCGEPSSFFNNLDNLFAQGVSEGKSIFVATGDVGTAAPVPSTCGATKKPDIEENAGSTHVTAVGASMFTPAYDNNGDVTSTIADTVQSPWKFSRTTKIKNLGFLAAAGASTGGYSKIFPLPTWQEHVAGISGKFRAVPDLVLGGGALGGTGVITEKGNTIVITGNLGPAPNFWVCLDEGFLAGSTTPEESECITTGGTSIVPPQYSGLFAIVAQKTGKPSGLINPTLYAMAKANLKNPSAAGIVDIKTGNNAVTPVAGYSAKKGYDLASGWGSIDMTNFVNSFIGFTP
jgi:subtilase family serine protease